MHLAKYALLTLPLVLIGCGGSNSALNSRFQPQITNAPDSFQFQSTGVTNVSETLSYTWQNTGLDANVDQATTITAGTAVLTIRDGAGTQVYSSSLQKNGTFQSAVGQAGNWTIQVTLQAYSGTINFRAQKRI